MHLWWMQKTKVKFVISMYLQIILVALVVSSTLGSSFPFFPLNYDPQQAIASTSAESNIMIPNKINFTIPEMSLLYPVNWNAVKGTFQSEGMNSIITFRSPPQNDTDNSFGILNIAIHDLGPANITTERYASGQSLFLEGTITDFQLIDYNMTTLVGRPAYQIVYMGLEGLYLTKTMKLWVMDQSSFGSTAYTITYRAKLEDYPIYLASAKDMINSLVIRERVARAPSEAFVVLDLLEHVPEPSRQRLRDVANLPILKSILGGDLTNFIDFIKGSTNTPPSNFAKLPTDPDDDDMAIYYQLSPAYLNATNDTVYVILAVIFAENTSNRALVEPIDYKVRINGTNLNFEENGSTSTGLDIKVINGTLLEEALETSQDYELTVDVLNINRIADREKDESSFTTASLSRAR